MLEQFMIIRCTYCEIELTDNLVDVSSAEQLSEIDGEDVIQVGYSLRVMTIIIMRQRIKSSSPSNHFLRYESFERKLPPSGASGTVV